MSEHTFQLEMPGGRLSGTLLLPEGAGPWPAALLIGGSGPTDRDGNNPLLQIRVNNHKRLAQELAARGIASLRYDKRGVGESIHPGLSEQALRFDHLVDDAVACAAWLDADPQVTRVVLVGHSEGALVAALAAEHAPAHALVSVSGAGSRASTLMRKQIEGQLPDDLAGPALAALTALEAGETADVPDDLVLLFRPTVQPYLISWFRHDPSQVLARLQVPVLLVQGDSDPQVSLEQVHLLQAGRPDARLLLLPKVDHLMAVRGDVGPGTVAVAAEMVRWLRELDARVAA